MSTPFRINSEEPPDGAIPTNPPPIIKRPEPQVTYSTGKPGKAVGLAEVECGRRWITKDNLDWWLQWFNEVQTVTLTGSPTGGTFTLTYGGDTTSAIAYNASASDVQSALEALSSIGTDNVSVTGSAGGPWAVEFKHSLGSQDVALMTGDFTGLTGDGDESGTITETRAGLPTTTLYKDVTATVYDRTRAEWVSVSAHLWRPTFSESARFYLYENFRVRLTGIAI